MNQLVIQYACGANITETNFDSISNGNPPNHPPYTLSLSLYLKVETSLRFLLSTVSMVSVK